MPAERFDDVIRTEAELRAVLGYPGQRAAGMAVPYIDEHFTAFIEHSPFVLIGSSDGRGNMDMSPRGDGPGFVRVLDAGTLVIPDRGGNRRGDTFSNVLENPQVGLYFMVPGASETLRVQGRALIVRDEALRDYHAIGNSRPDLCLVVEVEEAMMHCTKCMTRSGIWEPESWPDTESLLPFDRVLELQQQRRRQSA